jgi:hypothetical protein
MKGELRKVRVRRITVDEKLSDDLFRFVFCSLKEGIEKFADQGDRWQEEQEKLVHPRNYSRILDVKKSEAPAWETLHEGQVYLSGEFEVIGDQTNPDYFKVSPGRRKFLRIDKLDIIDEGVKSLYSDVLRRT